MIYRMAMTFIKHCSVSFVADVCVHIIKCEGVVKKLTELCADSSTGGHLTAEGSRLLSNLVKYSQNGGKLYDLIAIVLCRR